MTRHYDERAYQEARAAVQGYDLPALLGLLDDLYGRDNLRYGDDTEAVRAEALRQLDREWTMPDRLEMQPCGDAHVTLTRNPLPDVEPRQ